MASLQGLPVLPKSLSGLKNFSLSQWKEMERIHAMKTMIQEDLNRNFQNSDYYSKDDVKQRRLSKTPQGNLDVSLALLRKEMVGLRQLDMSLLCQLWSLNESIQDFKNILKERSNSPSLLNGLDHEFYNSLPRPYKYTSHYPLNSVPENLTDTSEDSEME